MKLGTLLLTAFIALAPLSTGCLVARKPVALAPAPESLKGMRLVLVGATDRLGPETTTALEHSLAAAGYVVTRNPSDEHDVTLVIKANGEEVQSVVQTVIDGQVQKTFHVTGTMTISREDKEIGTVPIDFECSNGLVADADVNGVVNALTRAPLFVAMSLQLKFDRELEAHKNDPPLAPASASSSAAPSAAPAPTSAPSPSASASAATSAKPGRRQKPVWR